MQLFPLTSQSKVFVAGHRGLVGSACVRALERAGVRHIITRSRAELDLRNKQDVLAFFQATRPDYVIDAAAKVGGIHANKTYPVDFLLFNLEIQNNLISAAHEVGVSKFLFLGSSCIYPKLAPQPIPESSLLTGPLEPTNDAYAIAKIAGVRLCQAYRQQYGGHFISAMPTNLFGINDNFHPENSHVVPALLRKFHEAKTQGAPVVHCWGTGSPLREFLDADDCAEACLYLLQQYDEPDVINIGSGTEVTIRALSELVAKVVGYTGSIAWDTTKPDGTPRKLLDSSRLLALGWKPRYSLEESLHKAYRWWLDQGAG